MKAYVVVRGVGAYSDRCEDPVKVYLNADKAQAVMKALEAIEIKYDSFKDWYMKGPESKYPDDAEMESAKEYEALGFEATFYNDWALVEVELED